MYKYDTTLFNQVLEALDTGKTIYFKMIDNNYYTIENFAYLLNNGDYLLFSLTNGSSYSIYPSSGYTSSQLYTPVNIEGYVAQEEY